MPVAQKRDNTFCLLSLAEKSCRRISGRRFAFRFSLCFRLFLPVLIFVFCQFLIRFFCNHRHHHISSFYVGRLFDKTKTPVSVFHTSHENTKKRTALCSLKNDAPCLTYVNSDTSLYQNSCGGYQYSCQ